MLVENKLKRTFWKSSVEPITAIGLRKRVIARMSTVSLAHKKGKQIKPKRFARFGQDEKIVGINFNPPPRIYLFIGNVNAHGILNLVTWCIG